MKDHTVEEIEENPIQSEPKMPPLEAVTQGEPSTELADVDIEVAEGSTAAEGSAEKWVEEDEADEVIADVLQSLSEEVAKLDAKIPKEKRLLYKLKVLLRRLPNLLLRPGP